MSGYRFKGKKVTINGEDQVIIPGILPNTPTDGYFAVDSSDNKLKIWNSSKDRWIILGDAEDIFFDNSSNGFTAQDVQTAIEEIKNNTSNKARFAVSAGFDGTASSGRYLEFNANVDSNQSGFVVAKDSKLREISVATNSNATVTFQVRKKDNTVLTSISLTNQRVKTLVDLDIDLEANLELMLYTSSGSGTRPIVWLFIEPL